MKIVDQKGRLFGVINVVDLLVLVAIIACIAGVAWKLFAPTVSNAVAPQVNMTTVVRVRGAMTYLIDELDKNPQAGKQLVSGNSYVDGAFIENVEIVPYIVQVQTAEGGIVDATDPSKKDVLVTITSKVPKGTATPKIANQEVRAGRTYTIKTQDFETIGTIDSVRFDG